MIIGLIGGSLFLLAGFLSLLPWAVSGSIAGVLLGSWFGGEIKKRLDQGKRGGKETRVIRFRKKALLEDNVSEMRTAGWEPRWESYRETQTGLLVRRIVYSVVMERKQQKRRGLKQLSKFLFPTKQALLADPKPTLGPGRVGIPSEACIARTVRPGIRSKCSSAPLS